MRHRDINSGPELRRDPQGGQNRDPGPDPRPASPARWRRWARSTARWSGRGLLAALFVLSGPLALLVFDQIDLETSWRAATRERTGLAPEPSTTPEAVVQVYAARAFNWRGIFGVHTWIATKERNADRYYVHQVLGWYARHGSRAVVTRPGYPDREWYGSPPVVLSELRGPEAEPAIEAIRNAIVRYPHDRRYTIWPGPNSNTFTAYVTRRVPALAADLPPNAIGKDYLGEGSVIGRAPSGSGFQISLWGLAGVLFGDAEGWEVNLLGLAFGLDPGDLSLRLPGVGKIGLNLGSTEAAVR